MISRDLRETKLVSQLFAGVLAALATAGAPTLPGGATPTLAAQGVRGHLTTHARWIELRPFERTELSGEAVAEAAAEGFTGCIAVPTCTIFEAGAVEDAYSLTQDVSLTAWGFGVTGLSATVYLRGRQDLGADFVLPRSDDDFDAIIGYLEWADSRYRVRAGRQRLTTGLGFSGYDGVSLRTRPLDWLTVDAYGGRSLAQGLSEPRHEALEGVEDFLIDRNAYLFGGSAEAEWEPGSALTLRYQREIWSDRSALVSERASLDLRTVLADRLPVTASADWDFAFERMGKARLNLELPLRRQNLTLRAVGLRYLPYFELWTIWGFFSPVAYHEGRLEAAWSPYPGVGLHGSAGYRSYDETDVDPFIRPLESETRLASVGATWATGVGVRLDAEYRLESGAGRYLSSFDAGARWAVTSTFTLTAQGTAFQSIGEFRIGEGVVYGGGLGLEVEVAERIGFSGGFSLYRNQYENRAGEPDWDQARGWSALTIRVGADPALRGGGR